MVDLTATEHRLLSYLARNAGRLVTLDQILEAVWGEAYVGECRGLLQGSEMEIDNQVPWTYYR